MRRFILIIGLACGGLACTAATPVPPMPPVGPPPMQFFRELLATNDAGRAAYLERRAPEQRRLLAQKIAEYQALSPAQRELRLTVTDLKHYLSVVLAVDLSQRARLIEQMPERFRPLVVERLKVWDGLSAEMRSELLKNERASSYLVRIDRQAEPPPMPPPVPPAVPRLDRFFQMSEPEQRRVLAALPADQRQIPEKLLAALESLPKEQREKYATALNKFLSLSPAEREQFRKNAARWQRMSAEQRNAVRDTVNQVPPLPPLPPGLLNQNAVTGTATPVPLPPMPSRSK